MKENYLKITKQKKDSQQPKTKHQTPKGITLVALVITIIILLIIAGVAISLITGGEGLFGKANNAATKYEEMAKNEAEWFNLLLSENWDKPISGLISDTQYKINSELLEFGKIAIVGENEELKTIKQGLDYLYDNGYKEDGAILLRAGTHDTADIFTGTSYNMDGKYNGMQVSIIADEPGRVFMNPGEMMMVETNSSYAIGLKFYRIVFMEPYYTNAVGGGMHLEGDAKTNEYYNCVFTVPVGGWKRIVSSAAANVYNCVFTGGTNEDYSTYPITGLAENCASTSTAISPRNGTKTTCLTNIAIDRDYNIVTEGWKNTGTGTNPDGTQANIGVYGGKYAWNSIEVEVNKEKREMYVNVNGCYERIAKLQYMHGTANPDKVIAEGKTISLSLNKATLKDITNGTYTFVATTMSGAKIIKRVTVEGLEALTKYNINNEVLEYTRIAVVGENEEFETIREGLDHLYDNGYKENGAILLREGTYDTADVFTGTSYNMDSKYNGMEVSFIGDEPGKTFMSPGEMMMTEINTSYAIGLKFYRIIFTAPYYSNASGGGFHLEGDAKTNEYYNCVFTPPVGGWNAKVSSAAANVYNCLFTGGNNVEYNNNPIKGLAQNCASTSTVISPKNGTKTTCLTSITVDEAYNITSTGWQNTGTGTNPDGTQANIGVYGGKYAW